MSPERTLSVGAYLVGVAELALIVVPLAWAAYRVRALAVPGWDSAPARLVEVVLGLAALIWLSELLGSFGAYGLWEMVAGSLVIAALIAVAGPRVSRRGVERSAPPAPRSDRAAVVIAAVACAAVTAGWIVPTLGSLAAGMDRADTLWYHMPLSARFVQTGSLDEIFFFDPIFFASFYPANSEVVHAAPILAFDRDIVSPVLNLGLLALGLLASWCIGRPYGLGPQALLGGAIALGAQMLVEFQAGEALNDITGVAFVLVAVAILVNGHAARRIAPAAAAGALTQPEEPITRRAIPWAPLAIAGIAAGLAAGTKFSFLAPVAALTLGVIAIAPSGRRLPVAAVWIVPMVVAGAYWYVRNWAAVGNPLPQISSVGPIDLPAPDRTLELRPGFSVAHYWNEPTVWREEFAPMLRESFGELWPATLLATLAAGVYALWHRGEPVLRMLGAIVLFTAVAYLFTPLTAAGEEGDPIAFEWNVRYLAPAIGIGLAILPCLPALRSSRSRRVWTTLGMALLLGGTVASLVQWQQGHVKGAVAGGVAVIAGFALAGLLRSRGVIGSAGPPRWQLGLAAAAVVGVIATGFAEQRHYLEHRYEDSGHSLGLTGRVPVGARPPRCADRDRGDPRRLQPVPLLRHRPFQPRPVAGVQGRARCLVADTRLRALAAGDRRRRVRLRRHHL